MSIAQGTAGGTATDYINLRNRWDITFTSRRQGDSYGIAKGTARGQTGERCGTDVRFWRKA
jgi:hypothetical protein